MDIYIEKKYKLLNKLGTGAFGHLFAGENINTLDRVAIKIEELNTNTGGSLLKHEAQIYTALTGVPGLPTFRSFGLAGKFTYLILDLLGPSLETIKNKNPLSLEQVKLIGNQALLRLEAVHKKGIVHRDIKPDNFLMGLTDKKLYLIDFGLAKMFIDDSSGLHVKMTTGHKIIGSSRYASRRMHQGISPSRRDDVESLGYILIYLLYGTLPWQGMENEFEIGVMKEKLFKGPGEFQQYSGEFQQYLGEFQQYLGEFQQYLAYCKDLAYETPPDYNYVKALLHNIT